MSQLGAQSADFPAGVAAGDVTINGATVWAKADRPGLVLFQLTDRATFSWFSRWRAAWVADVEKPAKVRFSGLRSDTTYRYRALRLFGGRAPGRFTTAARAIHNGLRFGVSGDHRGELSPFPAVASADTSDLDFFVDLGDTIYADVPSPALPVPQAQTLPEFRIKHEESYLPRFGGAFLTELRASTAWFAVIDDHEVTNDFAGGAHPSSDPRFTFTNESYINQTALYRRGLRAFEEYMPMREENWRRTGDDRFERRPKLYRHQRFGFDGAIFICDARSFRDEGLAPVTDPNNLQDVARFLAESFDPTRTMLGRPQLDLLERDLLACQRAGITWKFVFVPEPIQNLGVTFASDRFEGYAAERTEILSFIDRNGIDNVVFVAADLHGTFVNNLTYQNAPGAPQIQVDAFEVITGSIAYDAPLGPTLVQIAASLGLIDPSQLALYNSLPRAGRDQFIESLTNQTLAPLGYDPVGLQNSGIQATLLQGGYTHTHVYGWTEFDIDPVTQDLTVTTWGIEPYTEVELNAAPATILARTPQIESRFVVGPR